MAYRSELEALQARVRALEEKLARAEDRSRVAQEDVRLGLARRIVIERELTGDLDEALLERVVATLEESFGESGRIERVGSTTTWRRTAYGKPAEIRIRSVEGRVHLRLVLPFEREHRAIVGSLGVAGVGGAAALVLWATGLTDIVTPSALGPGTLCAAGLVGWMWWQRRRRVDQLRGAAARVLALLETELRPEPLRVRVQADDESDDDEIAEDDAVDEHESADDDALEDERRERQA